MGTEVAVTGLGLVTPAGIGVPANWAAVRAGKPAAAWDAAVSRISCRVPGFDTEELLGARRALRLDPFVQFALVAASEAIADARLDPETWDGARVGVVLGCADGGPGTTEAQHRVFLDEGAHRVSPLLLPMRLPNMLAGQMAMQFGAKGPNLVVATACASGATAVGMACDLLALDRCDVVLAGGSEAMLTPLTLAGFARMGALSERFGEPHRASRPFDADRDGFVAGEGAGVLVLERSADARARGVTAHARVVGHGASADAHHITKPEPHGLGGEAAILAALADAGVGPREVSHVNAHGTSTPANDRTEAALLARLLPHRPLVTSTKGVTGHLLGAAGAVEAVYTVLTAEHGIIPPTANLEKLDPEIDIDVATTATSARIALALSNSFGFGGQNAVLAIARA
ncbi:beta-ketoacyl-[acyl-carrier-protein] synthase family protein [Amycolatopsis sp. NPDC059021]|uniref:beta-ketoacyl-[acyl-carrier-protein] synthase family protein n=1 Tax=Amycolatopsis sp. NPDC059021 TaxID=3346704 RepID=UPI00366B70CE